MSGDINSENAILDINKENRDIVDKFKQLILSEFKDEIKAIVVFGSLAKNCSTSESDIDLAIVTKDEKSEEHVFEYLSNLETKHKLPEKVVVNVLAYPFICEMAEIGDVFFATEMIENGDIVYSTDNLLYSLKEDLKKENIGKPNERTIEHYKELTTKTKAEALAHLKGFYDKLYWTISLELQLYLAKQGKRPHSLSEFYAFIESDGVSKPYGELQKNLKRLSRGKLALEDVNALLAAVDKAANLNEQHR